MVSEVSKIAEVVFIRYVRPLAQTYLASRTYLALGPDMPGSRVLAFI
jgi:hypothetical protein